MAYIPDQSKGMTQAMKDELMRTLSGFAGMATSSVAEPIAGLNALLRGRPELVEQTRNALTYGNPADIMPRNFRLPEAVNTGIGYFNESADRLGAISPVAGAALKTAPTFVAAMLPASSRAAFSSVGGDIGNALANPSLRSGANAQRGLIGGISSKTADHKLLAQAKELADSGASREDIWNNTGWFKDNDGHWKYEIDDSSALISKDQARGLSDYGFRKQGALMSHPELFDAYPDTKDISTSQLTERGANGVHHTNSDVTGGEMIALDPVMVRDSFSRKKTALGSLENMRSTNLHELQHAIQDREGFSAGGNPSMFDAIEPEKQMLMDANILARMAESSGDADAAYGLFKKRFNREPALGAHSIVLSGETPDGIMSRIESLKTPFEKYKLLAGEAEARNVQARANMTVSERKAKPPWLTLDVPENELIHR